MPNRRITFEREQGPTPFRYRYSLEPIGGGTRLPLRGAISAEGLTGPAKRLVESSDPVNR